jgi:hypothetical protein
VFALLTLLFFSNPALAASPVPVDFAYGFPLPGVEDSGVYSLTLPLAVYTKLTRADLGDLRVFNGAGETVPYAFRRPQRVEIQPQTRQAVPFFPLRGTPSAATADLSVRVRRHTDGTVVTVDAGAATSQSASTWYLLDTSILEPKPSALELQWADSAASVFTVALAQSSDLTHWSPLVCRTVLADLNYQGNTVAARRIILPARTLPYLRLDCLDCQQPLQLQAVTAVSGTSAPPEQWQWVRLAPKKIEAGKEELVIEFGLDAKITVTGLQLSFAKTNTLARAVIESRPSTSVDWQTRAQGDFYALNLEGKELKNELAVCGPTSDYHWRIRIDAEESGSGSNPTAPQLELGWQAEELLFVGRGPGPYTLAFGSTKLADQAIRQDDMLLRAMRETRSEALIRRIEPGQIKTLGGEQALQPRLTAASWKQILLWAVLLAGVGLLALMARTIYREMQVNKS